MASLIGLQLVTSFITVAKTLAGQRETTQRQLNAEKKKHNDGPRVESLNKRLTLTHEMITSAEEMMRKIFTGLVRSLTARFFSAFRRDYCICIFLMVFVCISVSLCTDIEMLIQISECHVLSLLGSGYYHIHHFSCRTCT